MAELPDIPRPLAHAASGCHILAVQDHLDNTMTAACGVISDGFCGEAGYTWGLAACPAHGERLCGECVRVIRTYEASGVWDGAWYPGDR